MEEFHWPKTEDPNFVPKVQIIYGPLRMIRFDPRKNVGFFLGKLPINAI